MLKYINSYERSELQQKSCELYLKYFFGSALWNGDQLLEYSDVNVKI